MTWLHRQGICIQHAKHVRLKLRLNQSTGATNVRVVRVSEKVLGWNPSWILSFFHIFNNDLALMWVDSVSII